MPCPRQRASAKRKIPDMLVYVLEDDIDVARILRRILLQEVPEVQVFGNQKDFCRALAAQRPDLALVDLGLPDGNGLNLISDVLRKSSIATIVVTGRGDVTDRVVGLELGADDYIVKPFEERELLARVRAVLRRVHETPASGNDGAQRASFDGWVADFHGCVLQAPDGTAQQLSAAEAKLLEVFLKSAGRVLSRAQLLDRGGADLEPFDRSIDARVSRLRRKIGDTGKSPKYIRTVYGIGYVFAGKVSWTTG